MKYIYTGLISLGIGIIGTHYFYSKVVSAEVLAWFGAQSAYVGCMQYALDRDRTGSHDECNKIANKLHKDLQKAFGLIGS